ncbi:hypothetical protein [sulfur-oxidizing endosymbiont of Gigantopelta aegis]|uniref:hypothetical protein n=1 Tax=sulfur-oxidizing endosymbiont of Gigantopelta aegis TaxID=2794934 RepID=UPI0018DE6884|nr:hypothetical protein [sulfur-oxidizing endosymbiont of Gigantopelta aegis]
MANSLIAEHFKSKIKSIERAKSQKLKVASCKSKAAHRSLFALEPDQEQRLKKNQVKKKSRQLKENNRL